MSVFRNGIGFLFFLTHFLLCFAQKENRNWCFGYGAGIDFNDLDNPLAFQTHCNNIEANASISDSNGNLLFYLADANGHPGPYNILDGNHNVIPNGDSIWAHTSVTNGIVIVNSIVNNYYVFYKSVLLENQFNCPPWVFSCDYFFYSVVSLLPTGELEVVEKNKLLLTGKNSERVAAVRHANGKGWWIMTREYTDYRDSLCSNKFSMFFLTGDTILGPFEQYIGTPVCNGGYAGEMTFSQDGGKLAMVSSTFVNTVSYDYIELFDFDRCAGELYNPRVIDYSPASGIYGLEFSPNREVLYATGGGELVPPILIQYDLLNNNFKRLIWTDVSDSNLSRGQLQLGPDNKIYFTIAYGFAGIMPKNQYSQNLGVINHPDSLGAACDFQAYSLYLGDSATTYGGLPNMPNYNLGPLSIYQADAGIDTVICEEDTTVKGVILGVPSVSGVTYSWYPPDSLNYTNIAQPFASPSVSTWYYVTLIDTSIKYSCQSRTDSVFVEVRNCSVGIEDALQSKIKIFPNPSNETIAVSSGQQFLIREVFISDINGKRIMHTAQSLIDISQLPTGLYFIRVQLSNGQSVAKKVIID